MMLLNKLIAFAIATQGLSDNTKMFKNFLSSIAAILGLLLVITMMTGTLVVGGLYMGYLALQTYGYTTYEALSVLGGITCSIIAILSFFLFAHVKKLRSIPTRFSNMQSPITNKLTNIGQAFMDGLLQKP